MERTLTSPTSLPARPSLRLRVFPLWRLGVSAVVFVGLVVIGAYVRLEVQQLRKDMDRTSRATLEAQVLQDRLVLEMEARRRAVAMERAADQLGLGPQASLVKAAPQ